MDVGFFACQLHDDPLALRREALDRNWYIGDRDTQGTIFSPMIFAIFGAKKSFGFGLGEG